MSDSFLDHVSSLSITYFSTTTTIPWRVAVGGRGLKEGKVEVKRRSEKDRMDVPLNELMAFLAEKI